MTKKLLFTLLAVALLATHASATEMFEKVGTVGFQFLEIGAGPRGVGMGEAMVASADGIESIYWNPAGLRTITGPTLLLSYGTWPADITHQYAAYAMHPGFIPGIIGVSVTALSMDPMLLRTATNPDGVGVEFDCGSTGPRSDFSAVSRNGASWASTSRKLRMVACSSADAQPTATTKSTGAALFAITGFFYPTNEP